LLSKNYNFWKYNQNLCFKYSDIGFPLRPGIRLTKGFSDTEETFNWSGSKDTEIDGTPQTKTYPISKLSSIYTDTTSNLLIDRVFMEWKSNCPIGINDTAVRGDDMCCINIHWSSDIEDSRLKKGERIELLLAKAFPNIQASQCDSVKFGSNTKIIINATRAFLAPITVDDL